MPWIHATAVEQTQLAHTLQLPFKIVLIPTHMHAEKDE